MAYSKIILLKQNTQTPSVSSDSLHIDMQTLKSWIKKGELFKHLFRYRQAEIHTYHVNTMNRPLPFSLLARLLSRETCVIIDEQGDRQPVTLRYLLRLLADWVRDFNQRRLVLKMLVSELATLQQSTEKLQGMLDLAKTPVYLRTDLLFGIRSGGSIGHIAGVLNHLDEFGGEPLFLTTDHIPTVRTDITTHLIWPDHRFREFVEIARFAFNRTFFEKAKVHLASQEISFIYQRYSGNNYSGAMLAKEFSAPFVLEYNGSVIWMSRHWDASLAYEELTNEIEMTNLRMADVIVVVSQPMQEELVARGIDPNKILVNPNGVDTERYSPKVDGSVIEQKYSLAEKTVIGFIGTFGPWHGAEILAEAFGLLLQAYPAYQNSVQLLMIGDGEGMARVKEILHHYQIDDACILTGTVPQEEGPTCLAACDILASPHVPNPDGSPFFGSPTKLFEYMAMGKGIVASDLDQIGEILEHDHTAWMVTPGDAHSLMEGLKVLIDDRSRRERLGEAARKEVVAKYTWREHTRKIIQKLEERCA